MSACVRRGFQCAGARYRASAKPTAIGALRAFSTRKARGRPKLFVLTSSGPNLGARCYVVWANRRPPRFGPEAPMPHTLVLIITLLAAAVVVVVVCRLLRLP